MINRRVLFFSAFILSFTVIAQAGSVQQVKGKRVLLVLDAGEEVNAGDDLYSIDGEGKKKAIIKVSQVKNGKAIGDVVKGAASVGQQTMSKSSSQGSTGGGYSETNSTVKPWDKAWGVLGSLESNSMTASFTAGTGGSARNVSVAMTGMGFSALGFYDYPIMKNIDIRGLGGIQMYKVAGTTPLADCGNGTTTSCDVNITYLNITGLAKYNMPMGKNRLWFGASYAFLIAASKSSSILDTAGLSTNQMYGLDFGFDLKMGSKNFLPMSLTYALFPDSSTVKANSLLIRAGWAWNL